MTDYKSKSVLFIDNGLFAEIAVLLARTFKKVYYYSPWKSAYPKSVETLTGTGLPGITRVNDFWTVLDESDLVVFPDIYYGGLQKHMVSLGKRVWGSRHGQDLELKRRESKELLDSVGVDIGPFKAIIGIDKLREYLKKHDNQYVKISTTRGDMETFHSPKYDLVEPRLDELEHSLGPWKRHIEFIVEEAIDDAVEIGYDGFTIDGKFPQNAMWGIEIKDAGFVLNSCDYKKLPPPAIEVNDLMAPVLKKYQYRGFISSEIRVTKDGRNYVIDPCARAGSPPNELYQLMITNWPDIIWEGAGGVLVEPKFAAKWGAELMLKSEWAIDNWQPIGFPKSIRDNVKIHHLAIIDDKYYCVPECKGSSTIGAVVALGDTMDEAIKNVRAVAEKVGGFYIKTDPASLDEAKGEIEKITKLGFKA